MPNIAPSDKTKNRIGWLFCLVVVCFFVVFCRLFWVQVVDGKKLESRAMNQWMRTFSVTAKRGQIIDRNGKVLAQSASSVTLYATPKSVTSLLTNETREEAEKRARGYAMDLASVLNMEEEEIYKKLTDTSVGRVRLARQVKLEMADFIKEKNILGVEAVEDTVRAYPMGAFLTQVLGFCTASGEGQEGLEKALDETLTGESGSMTTEVDSYGRKMENGEETYEAARDGYTVRLTVDSVMQAIIEKVAEKALEETEAAAVRCVMMNVKTGEILGMVNVPDFDLNAPPRDDLSLLNSLTRNSCVQDAYEPGSTFKVLTTSLALENGVTSVNDQFYCKGYTLVDGDKISCWRTGNPHGAEDLKTALANSCNPVFVELALRMGLDTFYDGLHSFGIGQPSPVDLPGATGGQMIAYKYVRNTDLARVGFGQSVSVSPLQLLTACAAAVNGGELLKPFIVASVEDADGVVSRNSKTVVSTPISPETSALMRELLENVVENGGGRNAYIAGYRIGGKTGTAQKYVNGIVSSDVHICSFMGFAPIDDPEIGLLFIVDEPKTRPDYGSTVAAPYARSILEETMKYMGIEPVFSSEEEAAQAKKTTIVPGVAGLSVHEAAAELENAGLRVMVDGGGANIAEQLPASGAEVPAGSLVVLFTEYAEPIEDELTDVPDLSGLSLVPANRALRNAELNLKIHGSGICVRQDPAPGERVERGTNVDVYFE